MIHSYFYPRSPCGERLAEVDGEDTSSGDFYPRSPCGERPTITGIIYSDRKISIHALLAESDRATSFAVSVAENFYPRSPCGERPEADGIVDVIGEFLSTLSLRRATPAVRTSGYCSLYFYPRSPCGERPAGGLPSPCQAGISIHALLAESDGLSCPNPVSYQFLSTLSLRRATQIKQTCRAEIRFLSTLSLRRATDASKDTIKTVTNFYPRSPCGERPKLLPYQFASIPISIHALLAESDTLR